MQSTLSDLKELEFFLPSAIKAAENGTIPDFMGNMRNLVDKKEVSKKVYKFYSEFLNFDVDEILNGVFAALKTVPKPEPARDSCGHSSPVISRSSSGC